MCPDFGTFRLGVNYWPAEHAMDWLAAYDAGATRRDFARARAAGLDCLRVFVRWSDVQPTEATIATAVLGNLVDAANAAAEGGVELIVTLFVGHMSGVNWAPEWAAGGTDGDRRFRVVGPGPGAASAKGLRNWYSDPGIATAQERLAVAVASALRGHPAVWMWDLGNENSNCTIPPDGPSGTAWLERMSGAIREADPGRPITVGLHMEDLEDDRRIGPAEAARYCDVVSMHGYPAYTAWADGPVDDRLLPFLALLTGWLAGGAARGPVRGVRVADGLVARHRARPVGGRGDRRGLHGRALDGLQRAGCLGALLWCFADYVPALHGRPPFDEARHERSFGLWRADGSPKPAVAEITRRAGRPRQSPPGHLSWLDVSEFLTDRTRQLPRLYQRYCQAHIS